MMSKPNICNPIIIISKISTHLQYGAHTQDVYWQISLLLISMYKLYGVTNTKMNPS